MARLTSEQFTNINQLIQPAQSFGLPNRQAVLDLFEADLADFAVFTGPLPPFPSWRADLSSTLIYGNSKHVTVDGTFFRP